MLGEIADPLLVRPPVDDRPRPTSEDLLERDDVSRALALANHHHVERLVQDHLVTSVHLTRVEVRVQRDPELASCGVDVGRPIGIDAEHRPVAARGLRELGHLGPKGGELVLGHREGLRQPAVLRESLGELPLGLEQTLLERLDATGLCLELSLQGRDLSERLL